jgi:hypothetical protein
MGIMSDRMKIKETIQPITFEDLVKHRPDIVAAIAKDSGVEWNDDVDNLDELVAGLPNGPNEDLTVQEAKALFSDSDDFLPEDTKIIIRDAKEAFIKTDFSISQEGFSHRDFLNSK